MCAGASVCVCVCVCVRARALRIVSRDKILRFKKTFLLSLLFIITSACFDKNGCADPGIQTHKYCTSGVCYALLINKLLCDTNNGLNVPRLF